MKKLKGQRGFTLVEMLIVVAIIAVLIMVSIPMIGANLEQARVGVDEANERTAQSMAVAKFLTDENVRKIANSDAYGGGEDAKIVNLAYYIDPQTKQGHIDFLVGSGAPGFTYGRSTKEERGFGSKYKKEIPKGKGIVITLNYKGEIVNLTWQ